MLYISFTKDKPCQEQATPKTLTCPTCPSHNCPTALTFSTAIQTQSKVLTTASATITSVPKLEENVRLPRDFLPINYDVMITPEMYSGDPSTFTFRGHVNITLNCTNSTSTVRLHANKLTVSKIPYHCRCHFRLFVLLILIILVMKQYVLISVSNKLSVLNDFWHISCISVMRKQNNGIIFKTFSLQRTRMTTRSFCSIYFTVV